MYTACSRTSYEIVPLTNLNKYLDSDTSETEVNINVSVNNGSEKLLKKHGDFRYANYSRILAEVPGLARDDEWRNPIAFFP